jgi:hypothetical protein
MEAARLIVRIAVAHQRFKGVACALERALAQRRIAFALAQRQRRAHQREPVFGQVDFDGRPAARAV